ncbi:MAG: hypothetical protein WBA89_02210 [Microcoleus sp.]|uniref:hypothetical protein n=1 Tax=Microcoleus sp. TaxID=44472 RepID=UPI003C71EB76
MQRLFGLGNTELYRYLKQYALKNDIKGVSRTFPEGGQSKLYNKDGKHNTKYTVCHNATSDRTPYIRKSKQKQSATVAVQASRMQPSLNRFGKYPFIARSTARSIEISTLSKTVLKQDSLPVNREVKSQS